MSNFILLIPVNAGEPDFSDIVSPEVEVSSFQWEPRDVGVGDYVQLRARLSREGRLDSRGDKIHFRIGKIMGLIMGRLPASIDPQERFALLCSGNKWATAALDASSGKVRSLAEAWAISEVQDWMTSRGVGTIEGRPTMARVYMGHSLDPLEGR